jgi:hypothetical protein
LKNIYLVLAALIVSGSILIAATAALAQGGGRGEFGEGRGGFGGGGFGHHGTFGGSQWAGAFVPSIAVDVLLVPSLTKAQQTKIRGLYLAYRSKARGKMEIMGKLRGDSHRGGMGGDEPRDSRADSPGGKRDRKRESAEAGMESSTANLRRTLFMSMFKESEKFQADLLAVLDAKQKLELKDIAAKAGSPDYFNDLHYDKMNAVKSPRSAKDRPD